MEKSFLNFINTEWDTLNGKPKCRLINSTHLDVQIDGPLIETNRSRKCKWVHKESPTYDDDDDIIELVQKKQSKSLRVSHPPRVTKAKVSPKAYLIPNQFASITAVNRYFRPYGGKVRNVPGDGNCMLHAILAAYPAVFHSYDAAKLRSYLCDFLENNKDTRLSDGVGLNNTFYSIFDNSECSYENHIQNLRCSGVYGDVLFLYATAISFHINIEVFDMHLGVFNDFPIRPSNELNRLVICLVRDSSVKRVPRKNVKNHRTDHPEDWDKVTNSYEHYFYVEFIKNLDGLQPSGREFVRCFRPCEPEIFMNKVRESSMHSFIWTSTRKLTRCPCLWLPFRRCTIWL